jgi:hypothetical protein
VRGDGADTLHVDRRPVRTDSGVDQRAPFTHVDPGAPGDIEERSVKLRPGRDGRVHAVAAREGELDRATRRRPNHHVLDDLP